LYIPENINLFLLISSAYSSNSIDTFTPLDINGWLNLSRILFDSTPLAKAKQLNQGNLIVLLWDEPDTGWVNGFIKILVERFVLNTTTSEVTVVPFGFLKVSISLLPGVGLSVANPSSSRVV